MNAARWAQDALLARSEQPALRVYAVWFNMFPGDSREYWRADLLTDSRVVHLWDDERSVGRLYYQLLPKIWERRAVGTIPPQDLTLWDAYLLYAPEARWIDEPPDVISWGSTILLTLDRLNRDLKEALKR